ncbi:MAG: RNA methyltransferase [Phycisphaerales bacterium]
MPTNMQSEPLKLIEVADPADPRLAPYRDQKDAWLRAAHNPGASADASSTGMGDGLFMGEGELVVRELIASAYEVESVLLSPTRLETMRDALARLPRGVPIYVATREMMAAIAGFDIHRGVLACARRGPERDPREVIDAARLLVVMEDLANHDNVGGVLRSLGVLADPARGRPPGALLSPRCCDPLYRRALRVSIGHALHVPFTRLAPWPEALSLLRDAGVRTIALTPAPDAIPLREVSFEEGERVALLVGAEGPGLTPSAMARVDQRVRIEQRPGADSLNVVVAASIALAHLCGST